MPFVTETYPGVCDTVADATRGFVFNHSMLRRQGPASRAGFLHPCERHAPVAQAGIFRRWRFHCIFLHRAQEDSGAPEDVGERTAWTFNQRGILELTHNWGTENDPNFKY